MAKGLDKHKQRLAQLSLFGKDLTRRAKHRCELCQSSGVSLSIFEVPPVALEPEFERCLFLCKDCTQQLKKFKQMDESHWYCLNHAVWSQIPVVQVLASSILHQLKTPWASELLEQVYLTPEIESWVEETRKLLG